LDPKNYDALRLLGRIHLQSGNIEIASQLTSQAVLEYPDLAPAYDDLGSVLHHCNQHDQAITCYKQALEIDPHQASTCNNLCNTLLQLNRHEEGIEWAKQAIKLEPKSFEAYVNLGCCFQNLAMSNAATSAYEAAISINPDCTEAHINLGALFLQLGNRLKAEKHLRAALKLNPQASDAWTNLRILTKEFGTERELQQVIEEAIRSDENCAVHHSARAAFLASHGKHQAATQTFKTALQLDPSRIEDWYNLGLIDLSAITDEDWLNLTRILDAPTITADHKAQIHYLFSLQAEHEKDAKAAFRHIQAMNKHKRSNLHFDITLEVKQMQDLYQIFTADFFVQRQEFGNPNVAPIFLVSLPRSGSTLVEQILSRHPAVDSKGELRHISDLAQTLNTDSGDAAVSNLIHHLPSASKDTVNSLASEYLKRSEYNSTNPSLTDKMPNNYLFLGLIHLLFPKARIVEIVRDPMDTCFGCYRRYFNQGQHFTYDLEEMARYLVAYQDLMGHWKSVLPNQIYTLSYESLVQQPAEHCNNPQNILRACWIIAICPGTMLASARMKVTALLELPALNRSGNRSTNHRSRPGDNRPTN